MNSRLERCQTAYIRQSRFEKEMHPFRIQPNNRLPSRTVMRRIGYLLYVIIAYIILVFIPILVEGALNWVLLLLVAAMLSPLLVWGMWRMKDGELRVTHSGVFLPVRGWSEAIRGRQPFIPCSDIRLVEVVVPSLLVSLETTDSRTITLPPQYLRKDWDELLSALSMVATVEHPNSE